MCGFGAVAPSHGFDEQIFGANEQILERGQTYLSGIGLKAMWEEQRTGTLLLPPQSEEAEFNLLCQLRPKPEVVARGLILPPVR